MNSVNIIGRLTAAPELKRIDTSSGETSLCNFSIAVNERKVGKDEAHFFNVVAWGKQADTICQYINKGQRIGISGKLMQQRFKDDSGNNRSAIKIQLLSFSFIESKSNNGDQQHEQQSSYNGASFNAGNEVPF